MPVCLVNHKFRVCASLWATIYKVKNENALFGGLSGWMHVTGPFFVTRRATFFPTLKLTKGSFLQRTKANFSTISTFTWLQPTGSATNRNLYILLYF